MAIIPSRTQEPIVLEHLKDCIPDHARSVVITTYKGPKVLFVTCQLSREQYLFIVGKKRQ